MRISFDWALYVACNYRCPYCWFDGHWDQHARENFLPPLATVVEAWKRVRDQYGECCVYLTGGEPTVVPGFSQLMREISPLHRWSFNTNLSWSKQRWQDFASGLDASRGWLHFSYHPSQNVAIESFIDKALFVNSLGFPGGEVALVAYPPQIAVLESCHQTFKRHGLVLRVQPFTGLYGGLSYPAAYAPAEKKLIRDINRSNDSSLANELDYAISEASPYGKLCRSGQTHALINPRGDVYRCTQVAQIPENKMGNLFEGFELFGRPEPCVLSACRNGESRFLVK